MLALAMNPPAPADSTQGVKTNTNINTNKRTSEHSNTASEMLALAPQPVLSKRPKLSLQTSSLPVTFARSSTTLAIAANALPTASPTVLNTFSNAYDLPCRPSPTATPASATRLTQRPPRSMASFVSRKEDDWPYKVPLGIRGILRNTPIPAPMRKSSVCSNSASPRNGRRVFFPPTKRVCYRFPLEEEITTVKFVARHSDLSSSDESESDSAPEPTAEELDDALDLQTSDEGSRIQARPKKALKKYSRRQIQAVAVRDRLIDGRDLINPSKTPSDRKKRRRWEWTLGPLEEEETGESTVDLVGFSAADNATTSVEGQASLWQPVGSPEASASPKANSPAQQNHSPPPTILHPTPLPPSPADATSGESR